MKSDNAARDKFAEWAGALHHALWVGEPSEDQLDTLTELLGWLQYRVGQEIVNSPESEAAE